jgi:ubiquinol-cytochrome c reductase cytochrome b subunit
MAMVSRVLQWVVDRFGLRPIWDHVLDRQVPKDPWYHGDGMALLVLLTVLVVTGIVLALGYCPAIDEAHASVQHITHQQTLGWYVRGLHYWSGGLMVVLLFLHFCRQVLNGGYKSPREATWLVGVLLLFLVLSTSLLGYILRWDERGLYGLRVLLAALHSAPLVGESLVVLAQGGAGDYQPHAQPYLHAARCGNSAPAAALGRVSRLPRHSAWHDDAGRAC